MGFFGAIKDAAVGKFGKFLVNSYGLNKLGEMTKFSIDSEKKTIFAELKLKGEKDPLSLSADYELFRSEADDYIKITGAEFSREWLNIFFTEYIPAEKKMIAIPKEHAGIVKFLL